MANASRLGSNTRKRRRGSTKPRTRRSTRRARTRRVVFRRTRKAKTSTGKLWKYVKKATKSEVKRFDVFCPMNPTYETDKTANLVVSTGNVQMAQEGRYLTIAEASFRFANLVEATVTVVDHEVTKITGACIFKNQGYRIDKFTTNGLHQGSRSFEFIGSEIFLKYYSFKILVKIQVPQNYSYENYQNQQLEVYLIEEKITDGVSNLSDGSLYYELWDCMNGSYRNGNGGSQINGAFEVGGDKPTFKMMNMFCQHFRRRRLELNSANVRIKRLFKITSAELVERAPLYTMPVTNGSGTLVHVASPNISIRTKEISKTVIVPINRKIKIRDDPTDQRYLNYCYHLLPLSSEMTGSNSASDEFFRLFMTCEGVFTDK